MTLSLRLGNAREHVIVELDVDEALATREPYGWIAAQITVAAGAFSGTFLASLRADEFPPFRRDLSLLYERLRGTATLETLEGQLRVEIEGDGKGHLLARCEAVDFAGAGNKLTFKLGFDQTELAPMLRDLDAICEAVAPLVT